MKKFVSLMVIVALIASFCVAFVACNPSDNKASNTETLGTAVASVAQMTGAASASSASEALDAFEAGMSFDLAASANVVFGETIQSALNGVGDALSGALATCVDGVSEWVGKSNVNITSSASDKDDYDEKITITFTNGEGEAATTTTFALYVRIGGDDKDLESKDGYTFTADLFYEDVESSIITINGTAYYSQEKGAVEFSFSAGALLQIKAYATKDGKVAIDFVTDIGIATLDFAITVGKLQDGTYGATVSAVGEMSLGGMTSNIDVSINVVASGAENAGQFDIDGSLNATIIVPLIGSCSANATLEGSAVADASGNFQVGLTGSLDVQAVQAE